MDPKNSEHQELMPPEEPRVQTMLTEDDQRLIQRAVRWVMLKHGHNGDSWLQDELYHYGLVGLLQAKKSFRQARNIPFAAFAAHRIRGAMIDYLRRAPMVRVPQKKQDLRKQLEEARQDLQRNRKEESDTALARRLGWSLEQVRSVAALQNRVVSLAGQRQNDDGGGGKNLEKELPDTGTGPESRFMKKELVGVVQNCLATIRSTRDRLILIGRILHNRKLRELAQCWDCSLETVRLCQGRAEESMKSCLHNHGWDEESLNEMAGG